MMENLDLIIHEPARLRIMMVLSSVDKVDFNFLLSILEMTKGNLSSHIAHLEKAGYVNVLKSFNGKIPHTSYHLTENGRTALLKYWNTLDKIRKLGLRI
jgi:DNA-binding MarR family transcriptional regulator